MSFGEMVVLGVVAIVVVGPRNLPGLLRNAGQLIGRLRRMANDIRTESGIDEILDHEGIRSEIDNFKKLAAGEISPDDPPPNVIPDREREYPRAGCDAYGALSEDIAPYAPPPPALPGPAVPSALSGPPAPPAPPAPPHAASSAFTSSGVPQGIAQPSSNGAGVKS
jgi:sec-independent protein translocase protein TatB